MHVFMALVPLPKNGYEPQVKAYVVPIYSRSLPGLDTVELLEEKRADFMKLDNVGDTGRRPNSGQLQAYLLARGWVVIEAAPG